MGAAKWVTVPERRALCPQASPLTGHQLERVHADGDDVTGDGVSDNDDMDPYYTGSVSPGDSESKGVSISAQWLITPRDRVRASFRWQHSAYKTFNLAAAVLALHPGMDTYLRPGQADQSGREFGDPPIRGNVSYRHTFLIGDTGTLDVNADLYYEGDGIDEIEFMGSPQEYAMPGREAYWLGDISARYSSSYGMPSGMLWHVRFWCNNVWDSTDLASRSHGSTHSRFGIRLDRRKRQNGTRPAAFRQRLVAPRWVPPCLDR